MHCWRQNREGKCVWMTGWQSPQRRVVTASALYLPATGIIAWLWTMPWLLCTPRDREPQLFVGSFLYLLEHVFRTLKRMHCARDGKCGEDKVRIHDSSGSTYVYLNPHNILFALSLRLSSFILNHIYFLNVMSCLRSLARLYEMAVVSVFDMQVRFSFSLRQNFKISCHIQYLELFMWNTCISSFF